tara:strand:- start:47 stop:718 length:672 start_codon:yes stop_codon:yes gene_type:complete
MKQIPIKNLAMLTRLDAMAQSLYRFPHTFTSGPRNPDVSYAKLRTYMANADFVGFPKEHNYQDYTGVQGGGREDNRGHPNPFRSDFKEMKTWLLETFRAGIAGAQSEDWYYDTLTVMPADVGFTGWHNNKNKPHHSLRFIHNAGRGYSYSVENGTRYTIPDQWRLSGAGHWTVLHTLFDEDGETWFADQNVGGKPRFVMDLAIKPRYANKIDAAIKFLTQFSV